MRARRDQLRRPEGAAAIAYVACMLAGCTASRSPSAPSSMVGAAHGGSLTVMLTAAPGAHFSEGAPCTLALTAIGATLPRSAFTNGDARALDPRTRAFDATYTLHPGASASAVQAHATFFTCTEATCVQEERDLTIPLSATRDPP